MPWTYEENPEQNIVEVTFNGKVTARDLKESTSELIALEKEKGINKILADTTDMKFVASVVDIYDLPNKQYLEEGASRECRLAVVLSTSPKEKEIAEFFETVCQNSGWKVRTFSEPQPAIEWLQND